MLNFFMKLEQSDLISLVNEALFFADPGFHEFASNVVVYDEECVSDDGIICKLVKGISLIGYSHMFGDFYINDFVMLFDDENLVDCSKVLHAYMTNKFGSEYVSYLKSVGIDTDLDR